MIVKYQWQHRGPSSKKKFSPRGCAAGRFLFYALDWLKPTLTKKKFFEKCFFFGERTYLPKNI